VRIHEIPIFNDNICFNFTISIFIRQFSNVRSDKTSRDEPENSSFRTNRLGNKRGDVGGLEQWNFARALDLARGNTDEIAAILARKWLRKMKNQYRL
jgi:hypothetical protein